jgi:hypothetical protein
MTAGYSNTKGNYNSSFGVAAGGDNKIGSNNAFFGYQAGMKTTTSENSFFGSLSGYSNTSGVYNSFYGSRSGYSNTTGRENAFFGRDSGYFNTTGSDNSLFGFGAGYRNTAGKHNSFFGWGAGTSNTTGNFNSFFGSQAGYSNTEGRDNAFFGYQAGKSNTTGDSNTFSGLNAGIWNTLGRENTFIGKGAGQANTVESYNTMIGGYATAKRIVNPTDSPVENATAVGNRAYVTQSNSLVLGSINGFNGATVDVDVGIGVPAPSAPMHILRKDGNARILVEERATTPEVRTMLELQNNGGARITLKNTEKKTAWIFSTNNLDQFYFSRAGTTGAEVLLDPSGRLMVGPGSKTVFDLDPTGNLKIKGDLTANGVVYSSDRDLKENLVIINSQVMLEKLVSVPVSEWNFKRQDTRHIGPMAQDFYAAFGVGKDDKHLNPTDTAGVTIAAIQGLYQQVQDQNARMKEQLLDKDREISNLKAELKTVNQNLTEIRMLLGLTRLN